MSRGRGTVSRGGNLRQQNCRYMYSVSLQIVILNRHHAEIGEYPCLHSLFIIDLVYWLPEVGARISVVDK